jgi:cyclase
VDRKGESKEMSLTARAAAAFCIAASFTAWPQDFSKIEVRTERISDTVYVLFGAGGNIGLSVGEDAVFAIDDQYAPMTAKITAAIAKITPKPVKFILNTHWHGDHTGGNENFGKAGALIVAHDNVRKRMNAEQFNEAFNRRTPPSPTGALPVVTFAGAVTFHLNGDEIRAIHMPNAHTDGDAVVHFLNSDVIHMGDIYWNGMYPFIDTSSGGSAEGTIAAMDKVLAIATDKTRIIPGHGPMSGKAEMKSQRDMLAAISGRVKEMVAAGRKLEEILAADITAPYDARYGKGFIKGPKLIEILAKAALAR